jgi:PAS domain S-box-containing protein
MPENTSPQKTIDTILADIVQHLTPEERLTLHNKLSTEAGLYKERVGSLGLAQELSSDMQNKDFEKLVKVVPDIIYRINPEGYFTYINDAIHNLGYSPDELIGKHFSEILHPDQVKEISRKYVLEKYKGKVTGEANAPKLFDERRTRKRMTKWLEIKLLPKGWKEDNAITQLHYGTLISTGEVISTGVYNIDTTPTGNQFVGTIGIIRDITERKKAEAEQKKLEEKLFQWQKMESIGQLAGGIAHDFNNILGAISGYAELIKRTIGQNDTQLTRYIQTILSSSKRGAEITNMLLTFSRKGMFEKKEINIEEVIDEIIQLLEHSIDKRIIIRKSIHASPCLICADRSQIFNMLLNLALNARDAIVNSGEIIFSTEIVDLPADDSRVQSNKNVAGKYLRISVADNGQGIPEDIKEKIFDPFFTTKERGKGTGLGLSCVFGVAQKHQGFVDFETKVGEGSTFKVCLPMEHVKPSVDEKIAVASAAPTKQVGRILIVDDEVDMRNLYTEILEDIGYSTNTCIDGLEAIEYYQAHFQEIDLVVLDVVMPKLNGFDCFIRLKEINPNIKAVISSGYDFNDESNKLVQMGALAFIKKPFDLNQFFEIITQAIQKPQQ